MIAALDMTEKHLKKCAAVTCEFFKKSVALLIRHAHETWLASKNNFLSR